MPLLKACGLCVHSVWHALPTWPGAKSVQSVTRNGDTFRSAFTGTLDLHSDV